MLEFRAKIVSLVPLGLHSGECVSVSNDPRFALTVELQQDVPQLKRNKGDKLCLGLHSRTRTFGDQDVTGAQYRFRIYGSNAHGGGYYHVEAERSSDDWQSGAELRFWADLRGMGSFARHSAACSGLPQAS